MTTALPAAAPGTAGGLPLLDANALAPETPHTAANLDASVSAAATSSQVLAIATAVDNLAAQISSITVAPDVAPAPATYPGSLTTVRDQLTALLAQITLNPKPTYSAYGRKYSWTEYQALLAAADRAGHETRCAGEPV